MIVKLHPHQEKAVHELSNGKVLVGGVGVGKTVTALMYFYTKVMGGTLGDFGSIQNPMDIYVFTTALKRDKLDWQKWGARLGIGTQRNASVAGIQLVVDSYNNIQKYKDVANAFIILDEQRMVGSGSWTKSFLKMAKVNQWIMLSATPGDRWEDFIPLFIANGFYKNRTEFLRRHCVYSYYGRYPKLERYLEVGRLVRLKNSILVEMPYERHTTRHIHMVHVDYDKELFERAVKKRWHVYENRPLRDISELFFVMRKVVNSDQSRLKAVAGLLEKHPRLIVFYNFDYELEILRSLASGVEDSTTTELRSYRENSDLQTCMRDSDQTILTKTSTKIAEWNGHKHEPLPDSDRWIYLVQYVAGAEAWDCTTTNSVIFYSLTYSYKNFEQAQGRIDRINTPFSDLHYYVLMSDSAIDKAVAKALRNKKSFNERDFGVYT